MKKAKHYFLSANTNEGFWNFFNHATEEGGFVYVLKGGPGSGKSTLIRRVGEYFMSKGEAVDYYHCSSDCLSLDGVFLAERGVAVVDGTSPHTMDADIPSVNSKIVNLGSAIGMGVKASASEIQRRYEEKRKNYSYLYQALKCAGGIYRLNGEIEEDFLTKQDEDKMVERIICKFTPLEKSPKRPRHMFMRVLGDDGEIDYQFQNEFDRKIKLRAGLFIGSGVLKRVAEELANGGERVICFHDYLSPDLICSVYVETRGVLIERENRTASLIKCPHIDMLVNNDHVIDSLIGYAGKCLKKAKEEHFEVERIYSEFVDFEKINTKTSEVIDDIKTNFPIF